MADQKSKAGDERDRLLSELDSLGSGGAQERGAQTVSGIFIKVSGDEMKATAVVQPPMDSSSDVTKESILAALGKAGVKHGIDENAIEDIFTFGSYNVEVVVAKGTPASDGVSARVEYKFEHEPGRKAQMKTDEHGNVDHREINLIESIEEGALLAVKTPAVEGKEGMTVTGRKLPAKQGRDVNLPVGENTKATEDGLAVVSAISGQPLLRDGKVHVSAVYEIKDDVSYKTGNVSFKGTVIIRGNVQSDFTVSASDDIEIYGNVEKSFIDAGGDVHLRGGMYGMSEGKITAGGSVTIRSLESGIIDAGKNIVIQQQVRNSTLIAGEDIILSNPKGSITGGRVTCGHHLDLANLGSPSFTETVVEVGINPKIKQVHDEIEKRLEESKMQFEKIANHIKSVKDKGAHLTEKDKELLTKLVPAFHRLKSGIEADTAKINFIKEKMDKMERGRLKVRGKTFPGVKLYTPNASMAIKSEVNHSSFYEQEEQIVVGPY